MDRSDDSFLLNLNFVPGWHFCRYCKHLHNLSGTFTCDAFPEGVPRELLSGLIFHDKPLPGQKNSIVFTNKYKILEDDEFRE